MCSVIHAPYADVTIEHKVEFYYILSKACTSTHEHPDYSCARAREIFERHKDAGNGILLRIDKYNKENPTQTLWLNPLDLIHKNTFVIETLYNYMVKIPEMVHAGPRKFIFDVLSRISDGDKELIKRAHELLSSYKSGKKPIEKTPELEEFIKSFEALGFSKHSALCHLAKNNHAHAVIKIFDDHKDRAKFLDFVIQEIGFYNNRCRYLEQILYDILNYEDGQELMLEYAATQLENALNTMRVNTFVYIINFFKQWCEHHDKTFSQKNHPITKFTRDLASTLDKIYSTYFHKPDWFAPVLSNAMKKCGLEKTPVVGPQPHLPVGRVSRNNPPDSIKHEIPSSSTDFPIVLTKIPTSDDVDELETRPEHDGRVSEHGDDIADHEENLPLDALRSEINYKMKEVFKCFESLANAVSNPWASQQSIDEHRDKIHEYARVLTKLKSQLGDKEQGNKTDLAGIIKGLRVETIFLIAGNYSSFAEHVKQPQDEDMEKSLSELCKVMQEFIDRDTYNKIHGCSLILRGINTKQGAELFEDIATFVISLTPFGFKGIEGKFFNHTIITRLTRNLDQMPTEVLVDNFRAISMFFEGLLCSDNLFLRRFNALAPQLLFLFNAAWDRSELLKNTLLQMMKCSSAEGLKKVYNFLTTGYPDSEFMRSLRPVADFRNRQQVQQPLLPNPNLQFEQPLLPGPVQQVFNPNPQNQPMVLMPVFMPVPPDFMYQ